MSLDNPQRLEDLLNYRLSRLLALSSAPGIRLFEGGYGVSRREWSLVGLIAENGKMSPSKLAQIAHLDRAHVSKAITELVAKGLLVRETAPNDARRAQVDLTEKGLQLYKEIFPQIAALTQSVVSVLSTDQLEMFDAALVALTDSAESLVRSVPVKVKAARHLGESRRVNRTITLS
jgi:DNA-binding MarR family transcriptional regulator